jgi:hypothetical protein
MAVIRPTGPRRFRHFGSPEQGRRDTLRSVQEKPMAQTQEKPAAPEREMTPEEMARAMGLIRPPMSLGTFLWTLLRRWVTMVVLGWIVSGLAALVTSPLIWWGWNHGVVPLLNLPSANWQTVYAVTLCIHAVAGLFRSQLTVNSREE